MINIIALSDYIYNSNRGIILRVQDNSLTVYNPTLSSRYISFDNIIHWVVKQ